MIFHVAFMAFMLFLKKAPVKLRLIVFLFFSALEVAGSQYIANIFDKYV